MRAALLACLDAIMLCRRGSRRSWPSDDVRCRLSRTIRFRAGTRGPHAVFVIFACRMNNSAKFHTPAHARYSALKCRGRQGHAFEMICYECRVFLLTPRANAAFVYAAHFSYHFAALTLRCTSCCVDAQDDVDLR